MLCLQAVFHPACALSLFNGPFPPWYPGSRQTRTANTPWGGLCLDFSCTWWGRSQGSDWERQLWESKLELPSRFIWGRSELPRVVDTKVIRPESHSRTSTTSPAPNSLKSYKYLWKTVIFFRQNAILEEIQEILHQTIMFPSFLNFSLNTQKFVQSLVDARSKKHEEFSIFHQLHFL